MKWLKSKTGPPALTEDDALRAFTDGAQAGLDDLGRVNIAILGDTGVGKSSLVNAIFGDTRAPTGIGAPVTKGTHYYRNDLGTLGIWDFEGFEHGTTGQPRAWLADQLRRIQSGPADERIDVAWFCWDASSARVTDGHRALITLLHEANIAVLGVLTKAHSRDNLASPQQMDFARWIEGERLGFANPKVFLTAAIADPWLGPTFGLTEFVTATIDAVPDSARDAARAAQQVDLTQKTRLARRWIAAAGSAAATAAAMPLPVASAAAIAPIQIALFGRVSTIYGMNLKSMFSGTSALFQFSLQLTGKAAAQSLVKLIPGAGSVINASVAALWTSAAGEAWRALAERIFTGEVDPATVDTSWRTFGPVVTSLIRTWSKDRPKWLE